MSTSSHTKGPWFIDQETVTCFDVGPQAGSFESFESIAKVRGNTPEEALANSRLVATAPELLDACKMLLRVLVQDCDADAFASEISHAEGVIAKVEGADA